MARDPAITVNKVTTDEEFVDACDEIEADLNTLTNLIDAGDYAEAKDHVKDMRDQLTVFAAYLETKDPD